MGRGRRRRRRKGGGEDRRGDKSKMMNCRGKERKAKKANIQQIEVILIGDDMNSIRQVLPELLPFEHDGSRCL